MIKHHNCVTIECDRCGDELENGDGVIMHFPDSDSALINSGIMDEWHSFAGKNWHEDCTPACVCGDLFVEHDMGASDCEADGCECKAFKPRPA